ncbi:MAG: S8 family peptidase [Bacteroidia bacterium]|jgi:hypothetical protein|nr:S8 family peptidase [Bacteroidia bacterium]
MKTTLKILLTLYAFSNLKAQTPPMSDSTFYYNSAGGKEWYYYQRDVGFARFTSGAQYTGGSQSNMITSTEWLTGLRDSLNQINFDTSATNFQINAENLYLSGYPGFEYGYLAITRDKYDCGTHNKWYMPSNRLVVIFQDAAITIAGATAWGVANNLTLVQSPDLSNLPSGNPYGWSWVFRMNDKLDMMQPLPTAARLWLANQDVVSHLEPDIRFFKVEKEPFVQEAFRPTVGETPYDGTCESSPEMSALASSSTPDALWHIRNNGNPLRLNPSNQLPMSGTSGADADICECWGEGYHGENIKVAVCDFDGFNYNHPDMVGQYLPGVDFGQATPVPFNNTYYGININDTHGEQVSSIIAALANTGANTSAVGVAYNSKILPYRITGFSSEIQGAIQQALVDGADIFNMSFTSASTGATQTQSTFYAQIQNAIATGRGGLGIVFVSSTGNGNGSAKRFPAMDPEVIGVGATTPDDERATPGQWFWTGGSTYYNNATNLQRYDNVAPGTQIMMAATTSQGTANNPINKVGNGASFAAPVVSGIAAILLSAYPSMTYLQVTNVINGNADKIQSGVYYFYVNPNVSGNGYSDETFFGRVNCFNAMQNPTTGIQKQQDISEGINLAYVGNDENAILFTKGTNSEGSVMKIYDISGRLIETDKIERDQNTFIWNTSKYTEGVYVINVTTNKNTQAVFKFIK